MAVHSQGSQLVAGVQVEPLMGIEPEDFLDAADGKGVSKLVLGLRQQAQWNSNGKASLLQDVLKKRRTEIEYLNGYVVQEGELLGVPTPYCDAASQWVRAQGTDGFVPDESNLAAVYEYLDEASRAALDALVQQVVALEKA